MKRAFLLLLICLFSNLVYAQDKKTLDSLQHSYQTEKNDTTKILILVEIAFQYFSTHADTSIILAKKALEQSEKLGFKKGKARSLNRIGVGYWAQGDYPKALHYFRESYNEGEKIADWATCGTALNNMGHTHYILKHYSQALVYFQQSLDIAENKTNNQQSYVASIGNIGKIYKEQGDYDKAIVHIEKSLALARKHNYGRWIAENLNELGLIYTKKKEYDKALRYHQEDLEICRKTGNELFQIHSLNGLAELYQAMGKYDESIRFGLQALAVANKIRGLRQIKDVTHTLYQSYKLKGNYSEALHYFEVHKTTNDSIFNTENDKKMADIETRAAKAETEKKDLELTKAKELGVFQQYVILLGVFGFCLLLGFSYFIFRSRQKEKTAKELVTQQNEEIQQQNEEIQQALSMVNEQKLVIEQKNADITASITYALRIQQAILPSATDLQKHFDCFVFFSPRDIVSGDFYWFAEKENHKILAVADCTGHGVSGAFMTMIGNDILRNLSDNQAITSPDILLNELHKGVRNTLRQHETDNQDGMDLSVIVINEVNRQVEFAGAKNPAVYIQNGELFVLKPDKMPIGGEQREQERIFTKTTIDISEPTTFYLFSDGYQDQFGGENDKKFMLATMKKMFLEIANLPMKEQQQIVATTFGKWKEGKEQTDDVLVIGLKI